MDDIDKNFMKLKDTPVFCLDRVYSLSEGDGAMQRQYVFRFENGYGASVVEFRDKAFSGGHAFEAALLEFKGNAYMILYDKDIMPDVYRGNATYISAKLTIIEEYNGQESDSLLPEA